MGPSCSAPPTVAPVDDRKPNLDEIGRRRGLTRSSLDRDLLRRYARIWAPFREEEFDLLEVGFGSPDSLLGWLEWFPRARVVGLDVRRSHLPDLPDRCIVLQGDQGDQGDPETLVSLIRDFRFRVVIDDGSREFSDQEILLSMLYPALEPGGFYCAESAWDAAQDDIDPGSLPTPSLQDLLEQVSRALTLGRRSQTTSLVTTITRQTASVLTLPRSIVLEKQGGLR